jgi:probable poly-beta-1,6-N-acetyl-D-glucosamine export protein
MAEIKNTSYNYAVDALRVIAILAVVAIHTTTKNLDLMSHDLKNNLLLFVFNQLVRFAVPLFFMISGFVLELNSSSENYFTYLKKRLNRIFIPYLFWSAVYYFFIYTYHSHSYFYALLDGSSSYQLYFIPTLLIFYLIFPFLHKYYSFISQKWVIFSLALIQILILSYDYYFHQLPFFPTISVCLCYFFSFFIGLIASRYQKQIIDFVSKWKYLFLLITLTSGSYVIWQAFSRYYINYDYLAFYSQRRPSILIYTLSLGSLLYYFFNKTKIFSGLIKLLSRLSFFVFFFHIIILEAIVKYVSPQPPALIFFFGVSAISFFAAYLIHKIPYLSKITG